MFRLGIIAIESGACVANPVYGTEKECFDQIETLDRKPGESVQLETDIDGRKYIVPGKGTAYIYVVEPVGDEFDV